MPQGACPAHFAQLVTGFSRRPHENRRRIRFCERGTMNDKGQNPRPDFLTSAVRGRAKSSAAIMIVVLILVGYVGSLLFINYQSTISLQQTLLAQLTEEIKRRAAGLSYFFAERKDDLDNLAGSTEVSVYYANRALGMSKEYGLSQSLIPIKSRFNQLIEQKNSIIKQYIPI